MTDARIQEQLKLAGITMDALSKETQLHVALIVKVTERLQLQQPRLNHILLKWSDLCLHQMDVDAKKAQQHCIKKQVANMCGNASRNW